MPARLFTGEMRELVGTLLENIDREWYGRELMDETGIMSGTIYPMLHRMHQDGWLELRIEEEQGNRPGPPKKFYKPSQLGITEMTKRLG